MFARRSAVVGVAGGFIAGTVMFGSVAMSQKRAIGKWNYYMWDRTPDIRNS